MNNKVIVTNVDVTKWFSDLAKSCSGKLLKKLQRTNF